MTTRHLDWVTILELAEGRGEAPDRRHLDVCPRCAEAGRRARQLLDLLAAARLPEPPEALREAALARLRIEWEGATEAAWAARLAELTRGLGGRLRECTALLVADSLRACPALRGAGTETARSLRYAADDYAVVVSLAGPDALQGQVSPLAADALPPGGRVQLHCGGRMHEDALGEFGEFGFTGLAEAPRELAILLDDLLIRLRLPA